MQNNGSFDEHRKFRRFRVVDLTFAVLRPSLRKLGAVKNISREGLAIEYIPTSDQEEDFDAVDIFVVGTGFLISKLPSRKIYDSLIPPAEQLQGSYISTRRTGISFTAISSIHQLQLNFFYKNYIAESGRCQSDT